MMASRGMGAIAPSKMPKGKTKPRRDNTDFTEYAEGGVTKEEEDSPKFNVMGGGGADKYGIGAGGRFSLSKKLSKDSDISAYLDAGAYKPHDDKLQSRITGGGISYTKRFVKGGSINKARARKKK